MEMYQTCIKYQTYHEIIIVLNNIRKQRSEYQTPKKWIQLKTKKSVVHILNGWRGYATVWLVMWLGGPFKIHTILLKNNYSRGPNTDHVLYYLCK